MLKALKVLYYRVIKKAQKIRILTSNSVRKWIFLKKLNILEKFLKNFSNKRKKSQKNSYIHMKSHLMAQIIRK